MTKLLRAIAFGKGKKMEVVHYIQANQIVGFWIRRRNYGDKKSCYLGATDVSGQEYHLPRPIEDHDSSAVRLPSGETFMTEERAQAEFRDLWDEL